MDVSRVIARIERKLAEMQRWIDSVGGVADWPAAMALSIYRTRPAAGNGVIARTSQRMVPHIWVRPASLNGMAIRMSPSDMANFIIYEEVFIEHVYDLDRITFTPDAIVDCGAFHGYFSLLAAARYPGVPVVAFEPNVRNLEALTANVRANQLAIDIQPAAVSTKDGTAVFSGEGCGGRLDDSGAGAVTVPLRDLRNVLAALKPQRLLLKLDIEGEESAVLPALMPVLPRTCAIFFEWHHGRAAYDTAATQLTAYGFSVSVTRENAVADAHYIDAFAERR
jgi:FkbM family methyltransferase